MEAPVPSAIHGGQLIGRGSALRNGLFLYGGGIPIHSGVRGVSISNLPSLAKPLDVECHRKLIAFLNLQCISKNLTVCEPRPLGPRTTCILRRLVPDEAGKGRGFVVPSERSSAAQNPDVKRARLVIIGFANGRGFQLRAGYRTSPSNILKGERSGFQTFRWNFSPPPVCPWSSSPRGWFPSVSPVVKGLNLLQKHIRGEHFDS